MNPTLIDLREIVGCEHTYKEVSYIMVVKGAAMLPGSFIGGFLVDRLRTHLDLFLGIWILVYGVALALLPWMTTIFLQALLCGIMGIVQGGISAGKSKRREQTNMVKILKCIRTG